MVDSPIELIKFKSLSKGHVILVLYLLPCPLSVSLVRYSLWAAPYARGLSDSAHKITSAYFQYRFCFWLLILILTGYPLCMIAMTKSKSLYTARCELMVIELTITSPIMASYRPVFTGSDVLWVWLSRQRRVCACSNALAKDFNLQFINRHYFHRSLSDDVPPAPRKRRSLVNQLTREIHRMSTQD